MRKLDGLYEAVRLTLLSERYAREGILVIG